MFSQASRSLVLTLGFMMVFAQIPRTCAQEATQEVEQPSLLMGKSPHTYLWQSGWGKLEGGKDYGNTHGCMVVDAAGKLYVNTDTESAVMIFSPLGKKIGAWGKEYRGGLHGMTLVKDGSEERLLLAHTGRHEAAMTTLGGKVIWVLPYPAESGLYRNAKEYRPTGVARAPDGRLYVADGYGRSLVHRYSKDRKYLGSFGGFGNKPGLMQTPHGLTMDVRDPSQPQLIVCDRENHRLQIFDLEGKFIREVKGMLRRPCNVALHGDVAAVADLAGRVTLLNRKWELIAQLGDQPNPKLRARNGIAKALWKDGEFLAPHSACFDQVGNLYVMDWNKFGRITKLARQ